MASNDWLLQAKRLEDQTANVCCLFQRLDIETSEVKAIENHITYEKEQQNEYSAKTEQLVADLQLQCRVNTEVSQGLLKNIGETSQQNG